MIGVPGLWAVGEHGRRAGLSELCAVVFIDQLPAAAYKEDINI